MSDQSLHLQEQKFKEKKKKKQQQQQLPDKCMIAAHNKTDVRESEREREREREATLDMARRPRVRSRIDQGPRRA
jgi:hypothetical protein